MADVTSVLPDDPVDRLTAEGLLSLSAVARRMPATRGDRPCHPSTVGRWVMAGTKVSGGRKVKLEAIRLGGKLVTSWPAVLRFLAAQQDHPQHTDAEADRTPARRNRAAEAAAEELERMGA